MEHSGPLQVGAARRARGTSLHCAGLERRKALRRPVYRSLSYRRTSRYLRKAAIRNGPGKELPFLIAQIKLAIATGWRCPAVAEAPDCVLGITARRYLWFESISLRHPPRFKCLILHTHLTSRGSISRLFPTRLVIIIPRVRATLQAACGKSADPRLADRAGPATGALSRPTMTKIAKSLLPAVRIRAYPARLPA